MTKLLLLPVFAFSITSNATSWVRVTEDNIQTLYVDKDRLVKREKEVVYWTLINYKNNNISSVIKYKTVCGERKKIQLYFSYYNNKVMTYIMPNKTEFRYPTERYLNVIKRGYKDCKLNKSYLIKALNPNK